MALGRLTAKWFDWFDWFDFETRDTSLRSPTTRGYCTIIDHIGTSLPCMRSDAPQADNFVSQAAGLKCYVLNKTARHLEISDEMSWRLKSWKKRFKISMVPSFIHIFVSSLGFCSLAVCFSLVYSVLPPVETRSFVLSIVIEEFYFLH